MSGTGGVSAAGGPRPTGGSSATTGFGPDQRRPLARLNPLPTLGVGALTYLAAWVVAWICFGILDLLVPLDAADPRAGEETGQWLLGMMLGSFGFASPGAILDQIGWRGPFQLIAMAGGGTLRLRSLDDPPIVLQIAANPLPVSLAIALIAFFGAREVQRRWHGELIDPEASRERSAVAGGVLLSSLLAGLLFGTGATLIAFFTAARIPLGDEFPPRMHAADVSSAMGLTTLVAIALSWGRLSAPRLGASLRAHLRTLVAMACAVLLLLGLIGIRGRVGATGALEPLLSRLSGEHRLGLLALPWPVWGLALLLLGALVAVASTPRPADRVRIPGEAVVLPLACFILAGLTRQATRTALVIQTGTDGFLGSGAREDHVAWEGSMGLYAPLAALALGVVVAGIRELRERVPQRQ